ncbi:AI-2E family transporter [Streptomyces turgidiscabies]|uniref:Putative membrane protein n=1 Tax=Streptomyces turgidiscabies (strain Car8) TaxID=698760 RepID=L7ETB7_STRT8|nr:MULTISPECIES: AI-2E family transporter [Streptomyces]ELP62267.1 putative membrane protein [Streptomyces turgidiscabies Car8]MDX3498709.1 AI-2E family transporter [Streptomyces turgidiscabies]GAQ74864.1 AI-2 transport protein TqsA [Streptomyces turgidiscabies]
MNSRTGAPRRVGGSRNRQPGRRGTRIHRTRTTVRTTGVPLNTPVSADNRGAAPLLSGTARRIAAVSALLLLLSGVITVGVWFCITFQTVVTPVLLALLLSALLGPFYRRLVRMKFNKSLAAGLTCAAVILVMGGAAYIVVNALIDTGDQIVTSVQHAAKDLSERFDVVGNSLDELATNAKELFSKFGGTAVSGVLSGVSLLTEMIATATLAILLLFFFLRDSDRAVASLHSLAPRGSGATLEVMARRAFQAIEGFMLGTTIVAFIDAVCITVGLLILQVPGAVGLGALVFIGAYIPYLGAFLSGAVAVLVSFADGGLTTALWVLGVVALVQLLEGNVFQPMIQSRTLQMHPAVILVALTAGASLAGILGMLLSVPLTAAAFGVLSELRGRYEEGADRSTETAS